LPGLVFFLGSTEQYKAMKVGITFFRSKLDLLCISKVLTIFCVFSKIRRKKIKHSRGHVACSPSARGDLSVGLSGARRTRKNTREGFSVRALGTRGDSGDIRRNSPGCGTRDTCRTRRLPGGVTLAGLHGALGSFWEGCCALGGFRGGLRRTRRLAAHSETGVVLRRRF